MMRNASSMYNVFSYSGSHVMFGVHVVCMESVKCHLYCSD